MISKSSALTAHPVLQKHPHRAPIREACHDLYGFQADGYYFADEAEDVLKVVGAVGVVDDAASAVGFDVVLVNDPFEVGAVAETVVEGGGGDVVESEEAVVGELLFVFGEWHLYRCVG